MGIGVESCHTPLGGTLGAFPAVILLEVVVVVMVYLSYGSNATSISKKHPLKGGMNKGHPAWPSAHFSRRTPYRVRHAGRGSGQLRRALVGPLPTSLGPACYTGNLVSPIVSLGEQYASLRLSSAFVIGA